MYTSVDAAVHVFQHLSFYDLFIWCTARYTISWTHVLSDSAKVHKITRWTSFFWTCFWEHILSSTRKRNFSSPGKWCNCAVLKPWIYSAAQYFSELYFLEENAEIEPAFQWEYLEDHFLQYSYRNSLGKIVHAHKPFSRYVNNANAECLFCQKT